MEKCDNFYGKRLTSNYTSDKEIQLVGDVKSSGEDERFVENNTVTTDYLRADAEEINANGIQVLYIAIKTDVNKDRVIGSDPNPWAIELYTNIKMKTDENKLPSATNMDSAYGIQGWVDTMIYHMSKLDFEQKTYQTNLNNEFLYKQEWIPKSGDIIIVNLPPYYPTLEIIDVDDDLFHYINVRPHWVLTLQSYTKKLIDFSYIKQKYPKEYAIFYDMVNAINEVKGEGADGSYQSNEIFTTNELLEKDNRNMNSSNKKRTTLFKEIFGD